MPNTLLFLLGAAEQELASMDLGQLPSEWQVVPQALIVLSWLNCLYALLRVAFYPGQLRLNNAAPAFENQ